MKRIIWPAVFSLAGFSAFFVLRISGTGFIHEDGLRYLLAFCYACLGVLVIRCCAFLCFDILYFKRTRRHAHELLRIMFSLVAYAILLPIICGFVLKYNVTGLLATSAVVSVVIGLALQDMLGNFFAGVSLHIEQPFKIGDSIKFRDHTGEVEEVSWRATTIRTGNNTFLKFPNGLLAHEPIEIFPCNCLHRHSVSFSAPYSISPQTVINIAKKAARSISNVSYEVEPIARITGFSDSSVNYEALFWMSDYMKVGETSAQLRERIWYAFYRDNVSMPFPTRHVLLDRMKVESRESVAKVDYRCVIEGIDVFEPLSTAEREVLLSSNVIRIYAPGEYIVKCGEPGDSMFIIGRGKAEVRMPSKGGPSTVAVLEAGGFFGEMSLFSGEPRSADVVVTEEAEVVEIMKSTFQKLLFENTSLAEAISKKVSERLASLQNYAFTTQQEGTEVKEAGLLERIKRFFNLS